MTRFFTKPSLTFFTLIFLSTVQLVTAQTADFAPQIVANGCQVATYRFNDATSYGGTGKTTANVCYEWDFGNGNGITKVIATANSGGRPVTSPEASYTSSGTYNVRLRIFDHDGTNCTNTLVSEVTKVIVVYDEPSPSFTTATTFGCVPYTATFQDQTDVSSNLVGAIEEWTWNFGDGNSITVNSAAPVNHTYTIPGDYQVTLTVKTNAGGLVQCSGSLARPNLVRVRHTPTAGLNLSSPQPCAVPYIASFQSTSTIPSTPSPPGSITTYNWTFYDADGTTVLATSSDENPSNAVTYNAFGTYRVTLQVTSADGCTDIADVPNAIVITDHTTDFTIPTKPPCVNESITFTETSSAGATGYAWTFGDGNTSTTQNGTHTYAASGTYNVTLTTTFSDGCTESVTKPVTVNDLPDATFQVSPTVGLCEVPKAFTFTPNITDAPGITYQWNFGDGNVLGGGSSTSRIANHTYTDFNTYTVTLTVTLPGPELCSRTETFNIPVLEPSLDFTFSPDPAKGCQPLMVTFTPTNIVANEAIASYIWTFGDGNTQTVAGPTPSPYTHTYTAGGTYSVDLEIVTTNGCRKNITKNNIIFVGEPPVINDVTFSRTGCRRDGTGTGITLTPVFGAVTADSIAWDFGDGNTLGDGTLPFNTTHLFDQTGNLTVTLRAYFNGCEVAVPYTKNIQIDGPVSKFVTVDNIGCASGSTITFNNMTSLDALNGTTTYTWDFGDGTAPQSFTSKQAALTHTYATPGDYTVRLTSTNDAAPVCTDFMELPVRITASNASFTASATDICRTTLVTLTNTSTTTGNGTIVQWQWDFGDGTSVTNNNGNPVTHTYVPRATPYTAVLTITEQDGCTSTSAPVNINVRGPLADFNTPATVCQNQAATFTDASTVQPNTNNIVRWEWNFGDPASGINNTATYTTTTNPTHQFSSPGTYTVTLRVVDNDATVGPCEHTITKQIEVLQPPVPTIATPRDTFCTADPGPIAFDASGTTGNIVSYTWDFGDGGAGTTFGGTSATPSHTYTADGLYAVTVTVLDVNGCSASVSKNIVTITPDVEIRANGLTADQVVTCPPGNITFTADPLPNAATTKVTSWQWDFGDGNVANVQNPPTHTYLFPGSYTVKLTAVTEAGCTIVKTLANFILVQGPEGTFTFTPDEVCYTGTVAFQITGLNNVSTYQLDFGNGTATSVTPVPGGTNSSTIISEVGTYNGPGVFTPILTLVDGTGCTVAYPSRIGPVTASGNPTANFTWNNGASGSICRNVQFTFEDASTPDAPSVPNPVLQANITTREWTIYDGTGGGASPVATLSGTSANYTFPSAGSFDVKLKVTTGFGCTAEITKTVTVVEPNITAAFTFSPNNICPEEQVNFDASTSTSTSGGGGPLPLQYAWRFINDATGTVVGTSDIQQPSFKFPTAGVYNIELTVTDAVGCTNGSTVTQAITVQPKPQFSTGPSDATICSGDTPVTFSATVTAATLGVADVNYQWQVDDGGGFIDLNNNATYSGTNGTLSGASATTDLVLTNPAITLNGYRYRCVIQQVNTTQCRDTTNIVTLIINQAPTPASAGTDQNLCDVNTTNLAGNVATIGTGQWTQVSGPPATIANATSPTTAINGLGAGVYVFRWTISNAPCPPSTDEVTITNSQSANAGIDQITLCNATSANLGGNQPVGTGAAGTWSVISGPNTPTFTDANVYNTTVNGLVVGAYELEWQIAGAPGCGTTSDRVIIQNNSIPTFTVQPSNEVICQGQNVTFTVNAGAISYQWQIDDGSNPGIFVNVSNGGVYSGATTASLTVTGAPASLDNAKYRCVVTNTATSCQNTSNEVTLRVILTPTTNATASAANVCQGDNVTVNLDDTDAGYQYQLRVGTTPVAGVATLTGTNAAMSFAAFAPAATATYNVLVTSTAIGGETCQTQLAGTFTVTVDPTPSAAVIGGNQDICGATTATLSATTPTVGTGQWTSAGLAVVDNPANPNTTVSNLQVGANQFTWTVTNGSCPPNTATVTITRFEAPTANAGLDQTICPDNLNLNATKTPTAAVGTWTIISKPAISPDPTFADANSATTNVSGLQNGSYTFRWTVANGNCPDATDDVVITRDAAAVTSNAGTDINICATTATLNATAPTAGTGTWTIESGGAGATITNTADRTSTVTNLPVGTTTLRWTVANACGNATDDIIITRFEVPTANAGLDQTICPDNLDLNATKTPAMAVGTWTIISKPAASPDPTFADANSATSNVSGLQNGSYTFRWTVTNGNCPDVIDDVVVTRDASPSTSNAGTDIDVCATTATLNATVPTSGTGVWSIVSGGAGAVITNTADRTSTITNLPIGATTLRWTVSNVCGNSTDDVVVTRFEIPTANAGLGGSICVDNFTFNANKTLRHLLVFGQLLPNRAQHPTQPLPMLPVLLPM